MRPIKRAGVAWTNRILSLCQGFHEDLQVLHETLLGSHSTVQPCAIAMPQAYLDADLQAASHRILGW